MPGSRSRIDRRREDYFRFDGRPTACDMSAKRLSARTIVRAWPAAVASRSDVGVEVLGTPSIPLDPERRTGVLSTLLGRPDQARFDEASRPGRPPACENKYQRLTGAKATVKTSEC